MQFTSRPSKYPEGNLHVSFFCGGWGLNPDFKYIMHYPYQLRGRFSCVYVCMYVAFSMYKLSRLNQIQILVFPRPL